MPQIELIDTVTEAGERALDAFRHNSTRAIEGAGVLPERFLVGSLRAVRAQALRSDVVGAAARGFLGAVNTPAGGAASFFTLLEKESNLPRRGPRRPAAAAGSRRRAGSPRTGTRRSAAGRIAQEAADSVATG